MEVLTSNSHAADGQFVHGAVDSIVESKPFVCDKDFVDANLQSAFHLESSCKKNQTVVRDHALPYALPPYLQSTDKLAKRVEHYSQRAQAKRSINFRAVKREVSPGQQQLDTSQVNRSPKPFRKQFAQGLAQQFPDPSDSLFDETPEELSWRSVRAPSPSPQRPRSSSRPRHNAQKVKISSRSASPAPRAQPAEQTRRPSPPAQPQKVPVQTEQEIQSTPRVLSRIIVADTVGGIQQTEVEDRVIGKPPTPKRERRSRSEHRRTRAQVKTVAQSEQAVWDAASDSANTLVDLPNNNNDSTTATSAPLPASHHNGQYIVEQHAAVNSSSRYQHHHEISTTSETAQFGQYQQQAKTDLSRKPPLPNKQQAESAAYPSIQVLSPVSEASGGSRQVSDAAVTKSVKLDNTSSNELIVNQSLDDVSHTSSVINLIESDANAVIGHQPVSNSQDRQVFTAGVDDGLTPLQSSLTEQISSFESSNQQVSSDLKRTSLVCESVATISEAGETDVEQCVPATKLSRNGERLPPVPPPRPPRPQGVRYLPDNMDTKEFIDRRLPYTIEAKRYEGEIGPVDENTGAPLALKQQLLDKSDHKTWYKQWHRAANRKQERMTDQEYENKFKVTALPRTKDVVTRTSDPRHIQNFNPRRPYVAENVPKRSEVRNQSQREAAPDHIKQNKKNKRPLTTKEELARQCASASDWLTDYDQEASNDDLDSDEVDQYELELARLRKFTQNRTGRAISRRIASNPSTTTEMLDIDTKKAPDMAAYIAYQKMNKIRTQSVDNRSPSIGSDSATAVRANAAQAANNAANAKYNKGMRSRKSEEDLEAVKGVLTQGSFLATTTRQLTRPCQEVDPTDAFEQKCRKARVKFDFTGNSEREIDLKRGQLVWVYEEVDQNWFHGELSTGVSTATGIFPKSFVEIIDGTEKISNFRVLEYGVAEVLYDIKGRNEKELTATKGQTVALIRKINDNWWQARTTTTYTQPQKGIIPDNYLKVEKAPVTSEGIVDVPSQQEKVEASKTKQIIRQSQSDFAEEASERARSFSVSDKLKLTAALDDVMDKLELARFEREEREQITLSKQVLKSADPKRYEFKGPANRYQRDDCSDADSDDVERRVAQYEEDVKKLPASGTAPSYLPAHAERHRAIFTFTPRNEDELSLNAGEIVYVLEKCDDGWYVGSSETSGVFGTFPGNYVEPY